MSASLPGGCAATSAKSPAMKARFQADADRNIVILPATTRRKPATVNSLCLADFDISHETL
jgi:hypothetical protein